MKLIALITLVTKEGDVPPGGEIDIKDAKEAKGLIDRGFAKAVETKAGAKAEAEAEAKAKAEAEAQSKSI